MFFTVERIDRILKELKLHIYPQTVVLTNVVKKNGFFHDPASADASASHYEPFASK